MDTQTWPVASTVSDDQAVTDTQDQQPVEADVASANRPRHQTANVSDHPDADTLIGATSEDIHVVVGERSVDEALQELDDSGVRTSAIPESLPINDAAVSQRREDREMLEEATTP